MVNLTRRLKPLHGVYEVEIANPYAGRLLRTMDRGRLGYWSGSTDRDTRDVGLWLPELEDPVITLIGIHDEYINSITDRSWTWSQ